MINKSASLIEKLFAKDVPQAPVTMDYSLGVVERRKKNERVV